MLSKGKLSRQGLKTVLKIFGFFCTTPARGPTKEGAAKKHARFSADQRHSGKVSNVKLMFPRFIPVVAATTALNFSSS